MATNDFVHDLLDKLTEDKIEYLVITLQKCNEEHKAKAYFNITTVDGADMIITTVDQVYANLQDPNSPDELEVDWPDPEDTDK